MAQPQRPYRAPNRVPPRRPTPSSARAYGIGRARRSGGCSLIIAALLAVLCVGGAYTYKRVSGAINAISSGQEVRSTQVAAGPPPVILKEPFNVLVIGVDLRANQQDEGARSDTLIVVHVDPVQKWASMLSIPRDTFVQIPNSACAGAAGTKINAAYSCGYSNPSIYGPKATPQDAGAALAADTVEDFLGITIDYTAQVDFNGFQKIVDALGGITVDVPRAILDAEYPTEDNGYMRLYIPAGLQRMDGTTALRYARTRHADNDFGRAQRQQQVMQAVLDELKRQGLLSRVEAAPELLDVASQSVRTTIKLNDLSTLRGLAALAQEIKPDQIQRLVMKPETNPDGTSNLMGDLSSAIQWDPAYVQRIAQQFQLPPGEQAPSPAVVQVQNGTLIRGLAGQVTTDLEVRGYKTAKPTDAPEKGIPHTLILDYTGKPDVTRRLAQLLSIDAAYIQDASAESPPPNVDVVVRLGDDYQPPTSATGIKQ
ncbi:MAG TPA: LCP family protein [Herpetosiphonaceae bacterium]